MQQPAERMLSVDSAFSLAAEHSIPVTVTRAKQSETVFVRYYVFVKGEARLVQIDAVSSPVECRWVLSAHLQRDICLRSLSGVFACSDSVIRPLQDNAAGSFAPPPAAELPTCDLGTPAVAAARQRFSAMLRERANERFDQDFSERMTPQLRAGGFVVRRPH